MMHAPSIGIAAGASIVIACVHGPPAHAQDGECFRYVVEAIVDPPPCGFTVWGLVPIDINDAGNVVGRTSCGPGQPRAFVWWGEGSIEFLPLPFGFGESQANGINNLAHITGTVGNGTNQRGFLYDGEAMTLIHPPADTGAPYTIALDINDSDAIVGYWGDILDGPHEAWVWRDGVLELLGDRLPMYHSHARAINDGGVIAGWVGAQTTLEKYAFALYEDDLTVYGPMPGGTTSQVFLGAINDAGDVAGRGQLEGAGIHFMAFAVIDGEERNLGTAPGFEESRAYSIGNNGVVAGRCSEPTVRACVWIDGVGYNVNDLVLDYSGPSLLSVHGINDFGTIAVHSSSSGFVVLSPTNDVPGDVDGDCFVGGNDLIQLLNAWGSDDLQADLVPNGVVDIDDLLFLLGRWDR